MEKQKILQKIEHLQKHTTRRHKSIRLALEVKTFFSDSTHAMGSNMESSTQSLDFPLTAIHDIARREKGETYTQQLKKSLSDYAQQD
jgi:hypothetical protein